MAPKLHIIFDVDGTLLDTEYEISRIAAELATEKGRPASAESVFLDFAGFNCDVKFSGIASRHNNPFTAEELLALREIQESRKQQIYLEDSIPVVPGVHKTLEFLKEQGHLLSIGSSNQSSRSKIGLEKEGLLGYFSDRIYGADFVDGHKKPDPAVFLKAMQEAGSAKENTVVVEDSAAGIIAGHAAGAFVIAYLDPRFGFGETAAKKEADFKKAGADRVVRNFADITNVLPHAGIAGDFKCNRTKKPASGKPAPL